MSADILPPLRCWCRGTVASHVWEPGESCPPDRVFLTDAAKRPRPADDRLFATALEASVAAMKAEVRESARNALLNDLHDKLTEMEPENLADEFDAGFMACWIEVRTWMVSQGLDHDAENGTT